jgi:hypothetical protein
VAEAVAGTGADWWAPAAKDPLLAGPTAKRWS